MCKRRVNFKVHKYYLSGEICFSLIPRLPYLGKAG